MTTDKPLTTYEWFTELAALETEPEPRKFYIINGQRYKVEYVTKGHYTVKNVTLHEMPVNYVYPSDNEARRHVAKELARMGRVGVGI